MELNGIGRPIYEQKIENAFKLGPLLDQVEHVINQPSESDSSDDSDHDVVESLANGFKRTKGEKEKGMAHLYNFSSIRKNRHWIKDVMLSSSESEDDGPLTEESLDDMLKEHKLKKKYQSLYNQKGRPHSYMYYTTGILSRVDHYHDYQKHIAGHKRKKSKQKKDKLKFLNVGKDEYIENGFDQVQVKHEDLFSSLGIAEDSTDSLSPLKRKGRSNRKDKKHKKMDTETLVVRRFRLWQHMTKKEIGRCLKNRLNFRKETMQNAKKLATACSKVAKQKAVQSQKVARDKIWLMKRMTRTMQAEWKKYDRIMKEHNKRAEKEAEEQRKMDKEILEAKRQQRKLNFLITLPELYAHFMKNKSESDPSEGTSNILTQLDDEKTPSSTVKDDYDSESMKIQALKTAEDAFKNQQSRLQAFPQVEARHTPKEHKQPSIFVGELKSYQLKGMNWLANLYYFGINGILADEMGLGKTVQSVAFLAHVCEEYDTWGPFIIVTPASTLHNWSQEIKRFVPTFKVVPYWGTPDERKNVRKFFEMKNIGTRDASFHVVVTSYQIVVQDYKFLNRIKWNYMVLDEAQAIKSINSQRWKQLLGFSCRNRLLLSGTPIQNSMVELWALLHFIMPTLFDSHSWFNEWFSKDIESNVENRTAIDETHLNRLHLILKPFMLRRVKTEVENELSDKIEIMMYCPLTLRQKFLYDGLKNKISIDELLRSTVTSQSQQTLMNLVMQFRKVCNHPELLERREVRSPFLLVPQPYSMAKLVYREGQISLNPFGKSHVLRKLSIFNPIYIHQNLYGSHTKDSYKMFSFMRMWSLSSTDLATITYLGFVARLTLLMQQNKQTHLRRYKHQFHSANNLSYMLVDRPVQLLPKEMDLFFVKPSTLTYAYVKHTFYSIPETSNHRLMRLRKIKPGQSMELKNMAKFEPEEIHQRTRMSSKSPSKSSKKPVATVVSQEIKVEAKEVKHKSLCPIVREIQPTQLPKFLFQICPKVHALQRNFYSCDRTAAFEHQLSPLVKSSLLFGSETDCCWTTKTGFASCEYGGIAALKPILGWSRIIVPDKHSMIMDAGKLYVLDSLLSRLKAGDHRVLIYSQMTKMIDLLEEYMWHRQHKYMRLDGSSKISDRRDMVEDFQNKTDIFVFLLSTRAGGVGINLTAADTVIFYDSDWNPTVDQQAMDRAHRLGQTKQVTVYRLICKSTIEDRIMQRARDKSEIQRMVISGGHFKPDSLKPKEVVSLLLDDDIEKQYKAKQLERRAMENQKQEQNREKIRERMRKRYAEKKNENQAKRRKLGEEGDGNGDNSPNISMASSPLPSESSQSDATLPGPADEASDNLIIADSETPSPLLATTGRAQKRRGRPRGSTSRGTRVRSRNESSQGVSQRDSSNSRRGRGRPRLLPSGPSNMGTRQSSTLPMALQLSLPYSTQESSQKKLS